MIKLITGPMYSGKSASLIKHLLDLPSPPHYSYLFIRPEADNRSFITRDRSMEKRLTHTRHHIDYLTISSFTDLLELDLSLYAGLFVDELHLFDEQDGYALFKKILMQGVDLIAAGLNGSSEQTSFEAVNLFLPFISHIDFLTATCYNDERGEEHERASYSKWIGRKTKKSLIEVGDSEYVASCGQCLPR